MNRRIKVKWIVLAIVLCLLLLISYGVHKVILSYQRLFCYNLWEVDIDSFKENKKSYEIIANTLIKVYDEEKEKNSNLCVVNLYLAGTSSWTFRCYLDSRRSGNYYDLSLNVTENQREAWENVLDSMNVAPAGESHMIKVMHDRVVFQSGMLPYAFIFMRNCDIPTGLNENGDIDKDYFRERLSFRYGG